MNDLYNMRYYGVIFLQPKIKNKKQYHHIYYNQSVQIFQFKSSAKKCKKENKPAKLVTCQLLKKYKGKKNILKVSSGITCKTYISLKGPDYDIVGGKRLKGKTGLAKAFIEVCEAQKHKI